MKVYVTSNQQDIFISPRKTSSVVQFILREEKITCDEVFVYFVTQGVICKLHEEFFDDPSVTDCISFPMDFEENLPISPKILGEIFICPSTAISYCKTHLETNLQEEITLYLIHGLLHLIGYDDTQPKKQEIMRFKEKELIDKVKKNNLMDLGIRISPNGS